ncbi:hypothetical protein ACLBXM_08340 [Xanthobacteraceae bacterium A53D]
MTSWTFADADPAANAFAEKLEDCFAAADADAALIAFAAHMPEAAALPRTISPFGAERPHPLAGLSALLVARAIQRTGRLKEVRAFLAEVAGRYFQPPSYRTPEACLAGLASHFPYISMPLIDAAMGAGKPMTAAVMIYDFEREVRGPLWTGADPQHAAITADPRVIPYGPFDYEPGWALDQQLRLMGEADLDRRLASVRKFDALVLENALRAEQPARALPFLEARLPEIRTEAIEDSSHFGFNAVCVLAALGRDGEAMQLAHDLARRGYDLMWRFDLERAAEMAWTQEMRQNEWLGPLSQTPAYADFLRTEVRGEKVDLEDPALVPLAAVRDGELGGKKKARCFLGRRLIAPGEPIVRMRRLHGARSDDREETSGKAAFDASGWSAARAALEGDRIPLAQLFPPHTRYRTRWESPFFAAFAHDLADDPSSLDMARAARLIAEHAPPPIRHEWVKGANSRTLAFPPFEGDGGHGDGPNLAWRLVRAGQGEALLRELARLEAPLADKAFAMLATFDHPLLRSAAAKHFEAPDLPAMMDLAFRSRHTLADHLKLADFGAAQPRFRAGLLAAMSAYALHLYSNYHPGVDWYLQGLEHYSLAGGSRLLFFLIHHAGEEQVMADMLAHGWLPHSVGAGAFDGYGNSRPYFVRTVAFHLALHAPEKLDGFIGQDFIPRWCDTSVDRDTLRMLKSLKAGKRK